MHIATSARRLTPPLDEMLRDASASMQSRFWAVLTPDEEAEAEQFEGMLRPDSWEKDVIRADSVRAQAHVVVRQRKESWRARIRQRPLGVEAEYLLRMTVIKLLSSSRRGASCSSQLAVALGFGAGGGGERTTGLGALGLECRARGGRSPARCRRGICFGGGRECSLLTSRTLAAMRRYWERTLSARRTSTSAGARAGCGIAGDAVLGERRLVETHCELAREETGYRSMTLPSRTSSEAAAEYSGGACAAAGGATEASDGGPGGRSRKGARAAGRADGAPCESCSSGGAA